MKKIIFLSCVVFFLGGCSLFNQGTINKEIYENNENKKVTKDNAIPDYLVFTREIIDLKGEDERFNNIGKVEYVSTKVKNYQKAQDNVFHKKIYDRFTKSFNIVNAKSCTIKRYRKNIKIREKKLCSRQDTKEGYNVEQVVFSEKNIAVLFNYDNDKYSTIRVYQRNYNLVYEFKVNKYFNNIDIEKNKVYALENKQSSNREWQSELLEFDFMEKSEQKLLEFPPKHLGNNVIVCQGKIYLISTDEENRQSTVSQLKKKGLKKLGTLERRNMIGEAVNKQLDGTINVTFTSERYTSDTDANEDSDFGEGYLKIDSDKAIIKDKVCDDVMNATLNNKNYICSDSKLNFKKIDLQTLAISNFKLPYPKTTAEDSDNKYIFVFFD